MSKDDEAAIRESAAKSSGRCDLALWGDEPSWVLHELRQEIREAVIRDDKALRARHDFQGIFEGFDYEVTTSLFDRKAKPKKKKSRHLRNEVEDEEDPSPLGP